MAEQEEVKETPKEAVKEAAPPQAPDLIQKANEAAERIEKANLKLEENLNRQERIAAEMALGGESDAGTGVKPLTDDEKEDAEARKLLKGTGFEDIFDKKEKV